MPVGDAALVFEPPPGMFDEVTWRSPNLRRVRLGTVAIVAVGLVLVLLSGSWTAAVPSLGWVLGDVAVSRSRRWVVGAGAAGLDAGRFAIPWDRVSRIDDRGHVHLDPPARMSKAVALNGELRKVQLERRGWQDRDLGAAVARWVPGLLPGADT